MMVPNTAPQPLLRLLRTLQLGDATLPVGAFSFSNTLESALQTGVVSDVASLRSYIQGLLRQSAGVDGVALMHAHRAACAGDLGSLQQIDAALMSRRIGREQSLMLTRMGKKLAELAVRLGPQALATEWLESIRQGRCAGSYPVSAGLVSALWGVTEADAFAVHHYGVISMLLGASLRLMKIDHYQTQGLLLELNAEVDPLHQEMASRSLDEMASFAPLFDILSAHHEQASVRMFMN